jgi:hypothetical protein
LGLENFTPGMLAGFLFGQDQFALPRGLQAIDFAQVADEHLGLLAQKLMAVQGARTG